ncbi:MAG: type II toxin-antitoxin system Phd/YefM family antitoxin [Desulfonatronovibrio sp.]
MDPKNYSIAESKNHLPAIIHEVEKDDPVFIHRRGKTVAVLLSIDSYERLKGGNRTGFFQSYARFRSRLEQHPPHLCLKSDDLEGLRDQSTGREPLL